MGNLCTQTSRCNQRWLTFCSTAQRNGCAMNELLLLSGVGILLLAFAQHRLHATDSEASFKSDEVWRADLVSLRRRYLCGYIPAMLADWIMGAHIYALYQSFGYSMHDIALLFMIGFGSSLSLGTM